METKKKVSFPRYANYNCAMKYILENGLDVTCVLQPPLTQHTLEIGSKYSPDFVCTPFKTCLGSEIEALEAGADTLVMTYGLCKLGYYGELQEQILRDLGYQFEFVNMTEYNTGKKKDWLKCLKRINPNVKYAKTARAAVEGVKMAEYVDEITSEYYQNCGFELEKGAYRRVYNTFLSNMYAASSRADIEAGYRKAKEGFGAIPLDKPETPLRVGIVGEFYTVMDAFSNLDLERKLAEFGVEVHRWMNVSHRMIHYPGEANLNVKIRDLCNYEMGPTSTANIWSAKDYAERGFDGVVHVKSANCTPEIDIMPVLQNISADHKMPILYLTYDAQTSDVGLMTRLEAFYDMISMRKKVVR
jgi:predicted nucleotide-binding protein (sugar kinase/HSP70/actin superfamily)